MAQSSLYALSGYLSIVNLTLIVTHLIGEINSDIIEEGCAG